MDTVLITGGAGYIGSHAVKFFLNKGFKVVVIDNFSKGFKEALKNLEKYGDLIYYDIDLLDAESVREVFDKHNDIGSVLHFAAICNFNESMEKPELYFKNNVVGALNLLEVMREYGKKYLVFSSTSAVFGESEYLPIDESHPKSPTNPYGESKLMVEKMIEWYSKIHNINYVIFRYFNVCGADPEGDIGDSKKPSELLLQNAVRGAMGIEEFHLTCPVVDTPDGTPIRDYIDVNDLVEAHYLAYESLKEGGASEDFNLGSGTGNSVEEILSTVEKVLDAKIERKRTESRKGEYAVGYADSSKARDVLKWYPKNKLIDSIKNLENWYKIYPNGFDE